METQLELLTGVMRTSVTRADESTRENDEYGHARDSAIGHAVKIGDVSARIVLALGKLSGEFNHNITVNKDTGNKSTGRVRVIPESVSREAYPKAWEEYEVPTSSSHPPLDAALKRWHAEQAEIDAEEALARENGETMDAIPHPLPKDEVRMRPEIFRRKRGGQPGNRNRLKHGDYSVARIARRKEIASLLRKARHAIVRAEWIARGRRHCLSVEKARITMAP